MLRRMEMFRRINLFRTFPLLLVGPCQQWREGPVSIKEINWPFSPPGTNAPTNPVSPRGTLACFFKQEDFILAGQQDFPLHPPGFLAAHQNYFLLPIMRIVSRKQVDFSAEGRRGDESDSATSCCLLTGPGEGRGAQMVIPWGALIDASPDQTLTL